MTRMETQDQHETPESLLSFGFGETPEDVIRKRVVSGWAGTIDAVDNGTKVLDPDDLLTVLAALKGEAIWAGKPSNNRFRELRIDILAALGIEES